MKRRPYLTANTLHGIDRVVTVAQKYLELNRAQIPRTERDLLEDGLHYLSEFVAWQKEKRERGGEESPE